MMRKLPPLAAVRVFEAAARHENFTAAANELGIFEMTNEGLIPVVNPSKLFLSERPAGASGSVVIGCVEGSRPILVELQALVSGTNYATPRRMAAGVDPNRVSLLLAMLDKKLGMHLGGSDVYVINDQVPVAPVSPTAIPEDRTYQYAADGNLTPEYRPLT